MEVFLVFHEWIDFIVVIVFALGTDFGVHHTVKIVFMTGFLRFFLKKRPVASKVIGLRHFIVDMVLDERDLDMFCEFILFLQNIQQRS